MILTKKVSEKKVKALQVTALVIALAVIVGLFSLPIIFYYITVSIIYISNNSPSILLSNVTIIVIYRIQNISLH